jgi:hypothetical protein
VEILLVSPLTWVDRTVMVGVDGELGWRCLEQLLTVSDGRVGWSGFSSGCL